MIQSKPVLGIDIDDVLLDLNAQLLSFHNDRYDSHLTFEQWFSFDLALMFDCSYEEKERRVAEFYASAYNDATQPIKGAREALATLSKTHTIHLITARPEYLRESTLLSLNSHFAGLFESVHFTGAHHISTIEKRTKADVCRELGVETFVDDAIHNAEDVAAIGCKVYLLDRPWNQLPVSAGITRVYSWEEIVSLVLADIATPE